MVLGHIFRQLLYEAPVRGLLTWDEDVRRQDVHRLHIWRQRGRGRVGPQHQHPLQSRVDAGQVQPLQCGKRLLQESVDDVYGPLLVSKKRKDFK